VIACVTGATGFIGAHVARLLSERGDRVRVTYRDRARLDRLSGLDVEPVKADILDRGAMRRAAKGAEVLFHAAGYVASRPVRRVWDVNALGPRIAVEAAAAEGVGRVVLTSSVGGIGPAPPGKVGDEHDVYWAGGLGLTYPAAKHEGETEALAAGARLGVEVVIVNPSYVLGVPVDRSQPGETSTRTIAHYMRGRLPAVVDGDTNLVDVEDVAAGHLLAAERGKPGERYVLGGHNLRWVDLIDGVAELSGVHHPVAVIPVELASILGAYDHLRLPDFIPAAETFTLMSQNWRYSSDKARKELGYRARPLDDTLTACIKWCRELIESGAFDDEGASTLSMTAAAMRLGERFGVVGGLKVVERLAGRRLVAGA
jgi:dihydroflavonol-4-reductase